MMISNRSVSRSFTAQLHCRVVVEQQVFQPVVHHRVHVLDATVRSGERRAVFAKQHTAKIVYQPAGPDITEQLGALINVATQLTTGGRRTGDS